MVEQREWSSNAELGMEQQISRRSEGRVEQAMGAGKNKNFQIDETGSLFRSRISGDLWRDFIQAFRIT